MKIVIRIAALLAVCLSALAAAIPISPCPGGTYKGIFIIDWCTGGSVCSIFELSHFWQAACPVFCCPKPGGGYNLVFISKSCGPWEETNCCRRDGSGDWYQTENPPSCP